MNRVLEIGTKLEDKWLVLDRIFGNKCVLYVLQDLEYDLVRNMIKESSFKPVIDSKRPKIVIGKMLRPELTNDDNIARFENECYIWLSLGYNKHIVQLYTLDRFNDQICALGEYIPSTLLPNTLRGWLEHNLIEIEFALKFSVEMCRGVRYTRSKGVDIHQDLKPENMMITQSGVLKITDWEFSQKTASNISNLPSVIADAPYKYDYRIQLSNQGTPNYAAPELYGAKSSISPAVDMFSLGAIITELITGSIPRANDKVTFSKALGELVNSETINTLSLIITSCLSSNPFERPDSVDPLEDILSAAFKEITGFPLLENERQADQDYSLLGQQAYGLRMLGKLDEAMSIQSKIDNYLYSRSGIRNATPSIILMDYKEHGFKPLVPAELLEKAKSDLQNNPENFETAVQAALLLETNREYDQAIDILEKVLANEPASKIAIVALKNALKSRAWERAKNGFVEDGLKDFDMIIGLEPDDVDGWLGRYHYCSQNALIEERISSIEHAVKIRPEDANIKYYYHYERGIRFMEKEEYMAAIEEFEISKLINPSVADTWHYIGMCWIYQNNDAKGFENLIKAVEINPNNKAAFNNLGIICLKGRLLQEAMIYFKKAIAIDPNYEKPWYHLGQLHEYTKNFDDAVQAYEEAIRINPLYKKAIDALESIQKRGSYGEL